VIILTIPDFSAAPNGHLYGSGRNIPDGITDFNNIIKDEASKRSVTVIDIFPLSQQMRGNPSLVAQDKLHPSSDEYAKWVASMLPSVIEQLSTAKDNANN
jgi:lysophospholipase L1-like esterase